MADRRRRFRDGTLGHRPDRADPGGRASARCCPDLPEDLTETGLAWRDEDGQLVSHTLLVAVGRMLSVQGVPLRAGLGRCSSTRPRPPASSARRCATHLSEHVADDDASHDDLAKVAVQLSATAFEIAFLAAASRDEQEPGTRPAGLSRASPVSRPRR